MINKIFKGRKIKEYKVNEDGEIHRLDGPAIIREDGTMEWWKNGILHREDGPAIIYPNGNMEWYSNGFKCDFEKWCIWRKKTDDEKIILKLRYGVI